MNKEDKRTFTFRAVLIGLVAMVVLALWTQFHEVLSPEIGTQPRTLIENTPPAGSVGVFVGLLAVCGVLSFFHRSLRLNRRELVVIYAMLIIGAPIMTQGMWHRFVGLIEAIPMNITNLPLADSYSDKLWPHGTQLIADGRFEGKLSGVSPDPYKPRTGLETAREFTSFFWGDYPQGVRKISIVNSPAGGGSAVSLANPTPSNPEDITETSISVPIESKPGEGDALVPGGRYYMAFLVKLRGLGSRSVFALDVVADSGESSPILTIRKDTVTNFSQAEGFQRQGRPSILIPRSTNKSASLVFRLTGPGKAALTDLKVFSNEALVRLHEGSTEIAQADLEKLPPDQREALLVRPNNNDRLGQWWYVIKGYIPYQQWITPVVAWGSIVLAIFLGLLGLGVIMRRQWADNERFSFPIVVLPRLLIEQQDEQGRIFHPLFRRKSFRGGLITAFVYCLLLGVAFYVPGLPNPKVSVNLASYVSSPSWIAFFTAFGDNNKIFSICVMYVAIAFFIDLDMLLSLLVFYALSRIPYYLGETYGWKTIKGTTGNTFPFFHEQHIGAFLSLAVIALWVARKHLKGVGRRVLGLSGGVDDSQEAMRYRTASLLVLAAFAFFAVWGSWSGLGAGSAVIFFGFLVACGFAVARIRTECGAPYSYFTPYVPSLIFYLLGGQAVFGTTTMVLTYVAGGFMAVAQFLMIAPSSVEMLHLGNTQGAKARGVSWAMILGITVSIFLGGYVMLVWCYGTGGENISYMRTWAIHQDAYLSGLRTSVTEMNNQYAASGGNATVAASNTAGNPTNGLIGVGVGSGITLLLTILRLRFAGFWLHPIGYVLSSTYLMANVWGSLLVAWVIKSVALRLGGPTFIRDKMSSFFAGVFVGGIAGILFWDVVSMILMNNGARVTYICWP